MLIPFKEMFPRQGINDVTGIMHVGAHLAEELSAYTELGIHNVVWVEADSMTFRKLHEIVPKHQYVVQAAVSDTIGEVVKFNVANNGQSSSLLELGTHETEHPDVEFIDTVEVFTHTIEEILDCLAPTWPENPIIFGHPITSINMLNLDIQGAELKALKGAGGWLKNIKYIYTEVNEKELYKGCALLPDLDAFLAAEGFKRVETEMTRHGWGDALYVRA
jgi:FkbM family methyltransferase